MSDSVVARSVAGLETKRDRAPHAVGHQTIVDIDGHVGGADDLLVGSRVCAIGIHAHLAREFRRLNGYLVAVRHVLECRRRPVAAAAGQEANARHGYYACRGERDQ